MDIKDIQEQAFTRGYEAGRREAMDERLRVEGVPAHTSSVPAGHLPL